MLFVTKCLLTQIRPLNWFQFFGLQIDEMYLYNPHFLSYPRYIILVNCLKDIDLFLHLIFKILKTLKKSNIKLNVTISVWLYHFDINVRTIRRVSTSCLITWLLHIKVSLPVVRYSWIKHWIDCGRGGGRGRSPDRDHSGACLLPDSEKEVGGRILWVFTTFLNHLTIKIIFISTTIGMQYVLISFLWSLK